MICKYCMTKIDDDSVFCESCGSRVQEAGNNDETQLLPRMAAERKPSYEQNAAEKEIRVSDISKLLADIYDEEEPAAVQEPPKVPEPAAEPEPVIAEVAEPEIAEADLQIEEDIPEFEEPAQEAAEEREEFPSRLFCMACGTQLPEGAAFCDICGTATGEVAPSEIRRRKAKESIALPIIKEYFPRPADAVEKAVSNDAFSLGAGVFAVKDLLTALIAALLMQPLTENLGDAWIVSGDAFGFAAKVFLLAVLADMILIGLVFGASVLFKGAGTVKEIVGTCGTAYILPAVLWIISLILQACAPAAGMCLSLAALAVSVIFIKKAISAFCRFGENKAVYMTAACAVIYIAVIYGGLTWMIA